MGSLGIFMGFLFDFLFLIWSRLVRIPSLSTDLPGHHTRLQVCLQLKQMSENLNELKQRCKENGPKFLHNDVLDCYT